MPAVVPWKPITCLKDRYARGLLLMAPELVDGDYNEFGVGLGYWQDGPTDALRLLDPDRDGGETGFRGEHYPQGAWLACAWDGHSDKWREVACNPTHYLLVDHWPADHIPYGDRD